MSKAMEALEGALRLPSLRDRGREMDKLIDDEIIAQALKCPESEKVPLEVGDRVIALESHNFWELLRVSKGSQGTVVTIDQINKPTNWPIRVKWDGIGEAGFWGGIDSIGKLVPRRK